MNAFDFLKVDDLYSTKKDDFYGNQSILGLMYTRSNHM